MIARPGWGRTRRRKGRCLGQRRPVIAKLLSFTIITETGFLPFPSSQGSQFRILPKSLLELNIGIHRVDGTDPATSTYSQLSTVSSHADFVQDLYLEELRLRPALTRPSTSSKLIRFSDHQRPCQFRQRATRSYPSRRHGAYVASGPIPPAITADACRVTLRSADPNTASSFPGCWYPKDTVHRYPTHLISMDGSTRCLVIIPFVDRTNRNWHSPSLTSLDRLVRVPRLCVP